MTDSNAQPAPKDKAQMLEWVRETRAALDAVFARVPADQWTAPVLDGDRSVKDLLAHIATWDEYTILPAREFGLGEPGQPEEFADVQGIEDLNARIFAKYQPWPLAEVQAHAARLYAEMLTVLAALPEDRLTVATPYGVLLTIIGENTWTHYPEHEAQLAAWLADDGR